MQPPSSPRVVGPDLVPLSWELGWTPRREERPARFVPARVPGAVQLDWAAAERLPPYWQGENARAYGWMEDVCWLYRARLPRLDLPAASRLLLVFQGVDYACELSVAGVTRHRHEGMFSAFEIDVTDAPAGSEIALLVLPVPKAPVPADAEEPGRKQARHSCKPAVSYGWDFHPRLIPLGIWQNCGLRIVHATRRLGQPEVFSRLSDDLARADLTLHLDASAGRVRWTILDPDGQTRADLTSEAASLHASLENPRLWWPLSEGDPALYTSVVELLGDNDEVLETATRRFGLRRLRLVHAPGQIENAGGMPATQPPVPLTFEINHRRVFLRGANWVCPEIFPGVLTRERYAEQLRLVADAHLNLLRCWGGAIVNKPEFFELCDELGILVWQEFPLACNDYDGGADYLAVLRREAEAVVRRLRGHPCLALWCGGNELFNSWSGMTLQSPPLRLLAGVCFELDPERPFLPTSPLTGIRHGDYRFRMGDGPDAKTVFETYRALDAVAYMEFGVPGPADVEMLRQIIPDAELWPPRDTGSWRFHHAFGAWCAAEPTSWLYPAVAEHYFGPAASLPELVARLQLLQAAGYRAIYEEGRRQKPVCSALACWVFNEPWPAAANNSVVAWPNRPKPAYRAIAAACRPTLASARIPRFAWAPGEPFTAQLFLLHDGPSAVAPLEIVASLVSTSGERVELARWACPGATPNTHVAGPEVTGIVPARVGETFELRLSVTGRPELDCSYTLAFVRG